MRQFKFIFILLFFVFALEAVAEESFEPYWEYGAGFGYTQYSQYPSSDQSRYLFLPFPTFQYRGEILRADDRDGAHAYLLKSDTWTLEISGTGYLPVDSSRNRARENMENLPLVIAMGPRLLSKWNNDFQFGLGTFQGFAADLTKINTRGQVFEVHATYRWENAVGYFDQSFGKISISAKAATKEFLATYCEVESRDVTTARNYYESRGGYLNHDISYFQSFKKGFGALYMGFSYADFSWSANRQSPLHKADQTFSYVAGFTYVLGQSSKSEVKEEDTSGLLNKYKMNGPF